MKKSLPKPELAAIMNEMNMKLELNKEEAALVEQLIEMHIDMLECDADTDPSIMSDLKEAQSLHYKVLKFFRPL